MEFLVRQARCLYLLAGLLLSFPALADHHSWKITEIYSNADGTLQFIELASKVGGETGVNCCPFASQDSTTGVLQQFKLPAPLPGDSLDRYILIATAGFQAAYGLAPDYIMPDNYIATGPGALVYNPPDIIWSSIPTNGVDSINVENGAQIIRPATPINFAGQSITLMPDTTPPVISAIPGTLTIASNTPLSGADTRITSHFSSVTCTDNRDEAPLLRILIPDQLSPGVTTPIPITCTDASANLAEGAGSVRLNTFLDTDGDGIGNSTDPDDDNDGVPDAEDAFPLDESESKDTDGDGTGDNADTDDDGDSVPDASDAFPLDPAETLDTDGDGIGNNADDDDDGDGIPDSLDDDVPPVIVASSPLVRNATGRLTRVDLSAVTATDDRDGNLPVSPSNAGPFEAGRHVITWTARDGAGNVTAVEQVLHLLPKISMRPRQVVREGSQVQVTVQLSGNAPAYPVTISLTLSGTADAADYSQDSNVITISEGRQGQLTINIIQDAVTEPDESLLLTVTGAENAWFDAGTTQTITITESNLAPRAGITVSQAGSERSTVYSSAGPVTLSAVASDPDGDALTYEWRGGTLPLSGTSSPTSNFDPTAVAPGNFMIWLLVSDAGHTTRASRTLRVEAAAPTLDNSDSDGDGVTDSAEGTGDSDLDGIPDYLDNTSDSSLLPAGNGLQLQTSPGLGLRLGETALGTSSAVIPKSALAAPDVGYRYPSGLLDFELSDLGAPGDAASVVIPLDTAIPAGAQYRKYSADQGWQPFMVDADNAIKSASTTRNLCPLPGDAAYVDGLTSGHFCIELTISDGGPNDADAQSNQRVLDPGGLALTDLPPMLSIASSLTLEATSGDGLALPNESVTSFLDSGICTDEEDGELSVSNNFSGDLLSLGTTDAIFSCVDSANNQVDATAALILVDTTPPRLSVPGAVSIESREVISGSSTAITAPISQATCTDDVGGELAISDDAPDTFNFGTTTITLSCSDEAGNTTTGTLAVTVSSPPVPKAQGERGAGCFVATAAFGSHLDPHVNTLRVFRDRRLLTNAPGRAFVDIYYTYSPPLADEIRRSPALMAITRIALTPLVYAVAYPERFGALALLLALLWLCRQTRLGTTPTARLPTNTRK